MYRLTQISNSVFHVASGREKIGTIVKHSDVQKFVGQILVGGNRITGEASNAREVFANLVTQANRIALCGRNDAAAARKALEQRNARVAQKAAVLAADFEKTGLAGLFRQLGINPVRRTRSRRVAI